MKDTNHDCKIPTDWADARGAARTNDLKNFLDPSSEMVTFYATLNPCLADTDVLTKNPITEFVALAFPSSVTPDEHKEINSNLIAFRTALLEKTPENARPVTWSMGQVSRPGTVDHSNSPSGQALVHIITVGWPSIGAHMAARETQVFADAIKPVREKALPPPKGIEMRHAKLQKI